ncbi:type I restriction enzyme S subunit [Frisingicoccus caecimuris]|uniref:Type I restriction enzyme S subunit n=3 Tax=Frisingicoccus caecimuris TaxID=1796636 RepID=A0A4R2L8Y2_9FIRM|nr:restriction endonuclease subunit S [Frisingicoccus caecimuris]TCO82584.1 type I restriction enzyme S subunit [Frisingicoccus caecimuris]
MIDTKALREKILDLAIRGKLVPQDSNDEPTSVLLERIRAQKQQMVKEGKLKAKDIKNDTIIFKGEDNLHYEQFQDGTVKCIEDEIPFEVPEGWAWTRLCSVSYDLPYGTSKKSSTNGKIAVLRMGNLQNGEIDYSDLVYSSDEEDIKKYYLIRGDLLFNRTNSIELVGKTSVYRGDIPAIYAGYLIRIRSSLNYEYLNAVMNSSYAREYCTSVRTDAVNQSNINATKLGHFLIAIPSKSEQKRIGEKISESIKVINIIEQEKLDLQTMATNVKSKILDLAIRGKLVPQDPNDEPASVLLERIRSEKEELIKQGKIKRDKKESVIFKGEDNSYYEKFGEKLPAGWVVTNFGTFLEYEQPTKYIVSDTNYKSSYKTPVLTAGKSFILGYTNETDNVFDDSPVIIFDDFTTESKFVNFPFKVKSSAMKILHINTDLVFPLYAFYLMQTTEIDHENHQRYWISTYSQERVALPPLNEQKRILAKLEYYFTLLDQIQ